ncbi:MAG TPA: glycoside hydrolase family 73 protein [Streptosporangiaceae bacterium]|nr:glycoside hydrolase family 73 protein [Streptosporangiaceae bacterium]
MTGFTFAHGTVADVTSPASMPLHLLAADQPDAPDVNALEADARDTGTAGTGMTGSGVTGSGVTGTGMTGTGMTDASTVGNGALRSAIVKVARYYLRMAQTRTPAEMEALIWRAASTDGADHGPSCAAFASLTLALGAKAAGQQSWVTGGGSYPWPLQPWADVRVQPNPASLDVTSMQQDAQAHGRWHPLGDGYRPQPGDWAVFDGHVEVVIRAAGPSLSTIGADSLPDLTVNAHRFPAPFGSQGVLGFVDNGDLIRTASHDGPAGGDAQAGVSAARVPGVTAAGTAQADGWAAIPGADAQGGGSAEADASAYRRHGPPPATVPGTAAQQAFISLVAPGAIAAQHRYGVPAAVTIAQAIDESGWGQSELATADHNLFGIKGTGPAGHDALPTKEHENGAWVTRTASFRVYHNIAESIEDHGQLLATSPAYQRAMANRALPDAFANALTGVYATDPGYGSHLIALMRLYHLYQYDSGTPAGAPLAAPPTAAAEPRVAGHQAAVPGVTGTAGRLGIPGTQGIPADHWDPGDHGDPIAPVSIPGVAGALAIGAVRARTERRQRPDPRRTAEPRRRVEAVRRPGARIAPRGPLPAPRRYVPQIPHTVTADFVGTAKWPLTRGQPLYQDVASRTGIGWELLAACDWMQCQAQARYSPAHGEKLGTVNPDGTVFRTRSAALAQCASDLAELAGAVYLIDLTGRRPLSVRDLANVFAAFRWGGLLRAHDISAMEFPYSVAGLTAQHLKMRWPDVGVPHAPDKPGARFRQPFGAVPIVLSLGYRATA